jgi:hypothetical protein
MRARMWTYDTMNRLVLQAGDGDVTFAGTVSEPAAVTVQKQRGVVDGSQGFTGACGRGDGGRMSWR